MIGYQNFFSTELSSGVTAIDTTIPLNALPDESEGYLVLEPDSSGNREIIYYTSKSSTAVICPDIATGRGVGGTTAKSHNVNSTVKMNITAEHFRTLQTGQAIANAAITPNKINLGGDQTVVNTQETTTSATYVDLATVGPSITVTVGQNGLLLVLFSCSFFGSAAGNFNRMSFALSGANTRAAGVEELFRKSESNAGDTNCSQFALLKGLIPGSTTVTSKYVTSGGTATFSSRKIAAIPL